MDTKQIEYILKIAEENNITKAANKLFISQPALNQQLIRLEKELGTPLFHRSRNNLNLTEAGEIYIENAQKMLSLKKETYQKIHDLTEGKHGHLSIGFTAGRGISMFARTYPIFHQLYPNIIVEPKEGVVRKLQKLISQGELDVGFLTLTEADKTDDNYETIYEEELFLAVPSGHPIAKLAPEEPGKYSTIDMSILQYEPFALMDKISTMRVLVDRIFMEAGFEPQILFETGSNHTIISMIQANICCGILAYYYVKDHPDGITFFRIAGRPTWEFTASYKKDHYLSSAARCYIDLVKQQLTEEKADPHSMGA